MDVHPAVDALKMLIADLTHREELDGCSFWGSAKTRRSGLPQGALEHLAGMPVF